MKRLYRSRSDRRIAGVCGGLAEYFDIDPAIIRIAFVAVFLIGGIGLVTYLIFWVCVPLKKDGLFNG